MKLDPFSVNDAVRDLVLAVDKSTTYAEHLVMCTLSGDIANRSTAGSRLAHILWEDLQRVNSMMSELEDLLGGS